jgi:EF hand
MHSSRLLPVALSAAALILAGAPVLHADLPSADADFATLDTNHDGSVSELEFLDHHTARLKRIFAALDQNKDGALAETEVTTPSKDFFSLPRFNLTLPKAATPDYRPTAGTRGASGPTSRRFAR